MPLVPQTLQIKTLITSPKIPTDFLWGLSAFFVGLAVIYLISVFYFRNKITREAKKVKEKKKELSPIVSEFLFYDENGDKIEKINYIGLKIEVRELIKNAFDRKVLTEILMDLRKDVSGNTRTELFHIYQDLGLHEDAYKKLKSWRWQIISKGIFELTQMHVQEAYKPITRFINDKRGTVRKQAEIAVVTLKNEGISFFLDHTKYRISEWQQLKLLDVVRNKENYLPPPFRLWLTSKNNHVVLFALRLIKNFNQNDSNASLITLVHHKNNHIKREAIHCIKEFYVVDALPVLKQVFWKGNTDIKMHILDAISEIGTDADIPFLENIESSKCSFMVKNKAIRAINTIKPETILPSNDIEAQTEIQEPNILDNGENNLGLENISEEKEHPAKQSENLEILPHEKETCSEENLKNEALQDGQEEDTHILIEENAVPTNQEDDSYILENQQEPKEIEVLAPEEIAFLPLVTDSEGEDVQNRVEIRDHRLEEILVDFEEVEYIKPANTFNLSFLPLVVKENEEGVLDVTEINVIYEGVEVQKEETIIDLREFDVDFETVVFVQEASKPINERSDLLNFSDLSELECDGEISDDTQEDGENLENYIDWTLDMDSLSPKTDNVSFIDEDSLGFVIPKPSFHEKLDTLVLLENIEELGDEREIPFLKSMLAKESSPMVKERIGSLLDRFNSNHKETNERTDIGPSVFEDLLEKGDLESKLFLLSQIADLGDSKELHLLHGLSSDENAQVRKKAEEVLKLVEKRLELQDEDIHIASHISIEEIIKKDHPDFFKLNFEPSGEVEEVQVHKKIKSNSVEPKSTLFDHLCNISTKFYNKK